MLIVCTNVLSFSRVLDSAGLNISKIVGITVGIVSAIAILSICSLLAFRRHMLKSANTDSKDDIE